MPASSKPPITSTALRSGDCTDTPKNRQRPERPDHDDLGSSCDICPFDYDPDQEDDPCQRETQGGQTVTSLNIPVKQGWGDREQTNWFRASVWGKRADFAAKFRKGEFVCVTGELAIGEYNGKPQYEINASDFHSVRKDSQVASSKRIARPNSSAITGLVRSSLVGPSPPVVMTMSDRLIASRMVSGSS